MAHQQPRRSFPSPWGVGLASELKERSCPRPSAARVEDVSLRVCRAIPAVAAGLAMLGAAVAAEPPTPAGPANPDWPCIQHKVPALTSAQMWDGPVVDDEEGWRDNAEIAKLIPTLASRRVPMEQAAAAIETFAAAQPKEKRDEALKLLFAGLLRTINVDRAVVMAGIERLQKRQRALAEAIQTKGEALRQLRKRAETDEKARAEVAAAEERYNWDVRIFTDRQQSIPIACEVPVLIEQRLFQLAREIRARMQD